MKTQSSRQGSREDTRHDHHAPSQPVRVASSAWAPSWPTTTFPVLRSTPGRPDRDLRRDPACCPAPGGMERGPRRPTPGALCRSTWSTRLSSPPPTSRTGHRRGRGRAGKHVMCEKPLGLNAGEVRAMYEASRDAGVVHMTAFTYRFAPSMRYLRHLLKSGPLGTPRHFRSQRFLDWPETCWGWRQYKDRPGRRPLRHDHPPDRLRHRPARPDRPRLRRRRPVRPRDRTLDGKPCPPSDVDDWSCLIGEFERRDRSLGRHDAGQRLRS